MALAGGWALQAHGLLERPHGNVDLATNSTHPMRRITWGVAAALTSRGHEVTVRSTSPFSADLTVGTKIRALHDRGLAIDLIDARAASARFTFPDLENLARRHTRDDFDLPTLQSRLTGTDHYPDTAFTAYGLAEDDISELRVWAQAWSTDIAERLLEEGASPDDQEE